MASSERAGTNICWFSVRVDMMEDFVGLDRKRKQNKQFFFKINDRPFALTQRGRRAPGEHLDKVTVTKVRI